MYLALCWAPRAQGEWDSPALMEFIIWRARQDNKENMKYVQELMPCKITQCWKCASWKHRITDFWSYGILSLQNQIIPGEKKKSGIRNECLSSFWRMGWLYRLRSDRRRHKGKGIKQTRKTPTASLTKARDLYHVKSTCKSTKFTKTPADKWAGHTERQFLKEEIQLVYKH